jgi:thiamine kinase-like enzyme
MTGQRSARPRLAAVLEGMSFLQGEEFELRHLPGGLTNRNYRVTTASGADYVARFAGSKSALLGIDRDAEAHNANVAAAIGIGPAVVDYSAADQVLVVEWISGRTFIDADLDDPREMDRVTGACRTMHAGPRFTGDFDMFDMQRRYLTIVGEYGFRLPSGYLDFEPQARLLDEVLHASSPGTVPCHNDLLAANIMADDTRVWFIDYEYSGNNDPCFELGNLWSEANLAEDRLQYLIGAYFGESSPVHTARARLYALMAQYGWTLWASIQDGVSDVDFDFWEWGMEKYVRAVAGFRSATFQQLVDIVRESARHEGAAP